MMGMTDLSVLPVASARAVVINVGTELMTTLALASAKRHAAMPLLLVNCDPTPESSALFDRLATAWGFDVVEAPRRTHGATLDWLFAELPADVVLLLDSDAEIRSTAFVERMWSSFGRPSVFGAGFVEGPSWLDELSGVAPHTCFYQERPWVPCVMLRTAHVRSALEGGRSFAAHRIYNDVMWSRKVSAVLATRFQTDLVPKSSIIRRLPSPVRSWLSRQDLPWLAWARRDFYGHRPNYVVCDTAADVYQSCKHQRGLVFAGFPSVLQTHDEVVHYGGVTRAHLGRGGGFKRDMVDIEDEVTRRLAEHYDIDWDDCVRRTSGR